MTTNPDPEPMLDVPPPILEYWNTQETRPASALEIDRIEQAAQATLDPLYRAYLEQIGYKQFDILEWSEIEAVRRDGDRETRDDVTLSFLSPPDTILEDLKVFGKPMELDDRIGARIPPRMLPVGQAMMAMTGLILSKLDTPERASLWYWDRVDETWGTGDNTVIWFLGNDLNDMLRRVRIPGT